MRVALVGCGFFARHQLEAWLRLPEVSLVATCDAALERAEAFAARAGARAFSDARAMLEAVTVDVVDIATPPGTHRALVELAARFGCDVICQKPLAESLAEARSMVNACAAAGVRLTVHENFRFQPALRALHAARLELGRLHYARLAFRCPHDVYADQPYLAATPRFVLMDLGVHLLDLARFYLGEVRQLRAHTNRVNPHLRGEDHAVLLLTHANGACSVVEISYASALEVDSFPTTEVWLEGALGSARVTNRYGADAKPEAQRLTVCRLGTPEFRSGVATQVTHRDFPAVDHGGRNVVEQSVIHAQRHYLESWQSGVDAETSGADNLRTLALIHDAYAQTEGA